MGGVIVRIEIPLSKALAEIVVLMDFSNDFKPLVCPPK